MPSQVHPELGRVQPPCAASERQLRLNIVCRFPLRAFAITPIAAKSAFESGAGLAAEVMGS